MTCQHTINHKPQNETKSYILLFIRADLLTPPGRSTDIWLLIVKDLPRRSSRACSGGRGFCKAQRGGRSLPLARRPAAFPSLPLCSLEYLHLCLCSCSPFLYQRHDTTTCMNLACSRHEPCYHAPFNPVNHVRSYERAGPTHRRGTPVRPRVQLCQRRDLAWRPGCPGLPQENCGCSHALDRVAE